MIIEKLRIVVSSTKGSTIKVSSVPNKLDTPVSAKMYGVTETKIPINIAIKKWKYFSNFGAMTKRPKHAKKER